MEKHNGWANYATWRVNLEILSDIEFNQMVDPLYLQEIVEDVVFSNETAKGLIEDYARAFLSDVNYYEIAKEINKNNK